jgi:hypothetical protein
MGMYWLDDDSDQHHLVHFWCSVCIWHVSNNSSVTTARQAIWLQMYIYHLCSPGTLSIKLQHERRALNWKLSICRHFFNLHHCFCMWKLPLKFLHLIYNQPVYVCSSRVSEKSIRTCWSPLLTAQLVEGRGQMVAVMGGGGGGCKIKKLIKPN